LVRKAWPLEDLYVSHTERDCGAGKILVKHLAKIAVDIRFTKAVIPFAEQIARQQ